MSRIARTTKDTAPRNEIRLRELDRRSSPSTSGGGGAMDGPVASLYQIVSQSIPNATWTSLRWDVAAVDTHTGWSSGTAYVCPVPGFYLVSAQGFINVNAGVKALALRHNGLFVRSSSSAGGSIADTRIPTPTKLIQCDTGDTIEAMIFHNFGSAQGTWAQDIDDPTGCGMDIAWVRALPGELED